MLEDKPQAKYFMNAQVPFRELYLRTSKTLASLPIGTIVKTRGNVESGYLQVEWKGQTGWVPETCAEPYVERYPKDCVRIDFQTPDETDFEQYFLHNGIKQVNACGPLAICYILNTSLVEFMKDWPIKTPSLFQRVMYGGRMHGTVAEDLHNVASSYNLDPVMLDEVTKDKMLGRSRYTLAGLERLCNTGKPIVSVKIDGATGRLRGQGILHWVVPFAVETDRMGGLVYLYNPAPNRWEIYTWAEFLASAVQPYGIWVPNYSASE